MSPDDSPRKAPDRTGSQVRASYDAVAAEYADRISNELTGKPLDRALLDEVAARARGLVCDLGCGPGHVADYLHRRGASVLGVDLSPGMIEEARRRYPDVQFDVADMRCLPYEDHAFAAVVAMYSLIHFDETELRLALTECRRVLNAEGILLAGFHHGQEVVHTEEFFGRRVNLDFRFFEPEEIITALADAEFELERLVERDPYPNVEVETRRFYVICRIGARA
jgi:ubiquinone/menaquinone biosynthesis C-methylase UbiE